MGVSSPPFMIEFKENEYRKLRIASLSDNWFCATSRFGFASHYLLGLPREIIFVRPSPPPSGAPRSIYFICHLDLPRASCSLFDFAEDGAKHLKRFFEKLFEQISEALATSHSDNRFFARHKSEVNGCVRVRKRRRWRN